MDRRRRTAERERDERRRRQRRRAAALSAVVGRANGKSAFNGIGSLDEKPTAPAATTVCDGRWARVIWHFLQHVFR